MAAGAGAAGEAGLDDESDSDSDDDSEDDEPVSEPREIMPYLVLTTACNVAARRPQEMSEEQMALLKTVIENFTQQRGRAPTEIELVAIMNKLNALMPVRGSAKDQE